MQMLAWHYDGRSFYIIDNRHALTLCTDSRASNATLVKMRPGGLALDVQVPHFLCRQTHPVSTTESRTNSLSRNRTVPIPDANVSVGTTMGDPSTSSTTDTR